MKFRFLSVSYTDSRLKISIVLNFRYSKYSYQAIVQSRNFNENMKFVKVQLLANVLYYAQMHISGEIDNSIAAPPRYTHIFGERHATKIRSKWAHIGGQIKIFVKSKGRTFLLRLHDNKIPVPSRLASSIEHSGTKVYKKAKIGCVIQKRRHVVATH